MNMVLLSSLVVLFAIASMVAIAPGAFADHHMQTVTNAPGSSTPGCEDTADGCFIPSTVTIPMNGTVTWENNDTAAHTTTGGSVTEGPSGVFDSSLNHGRLKFFFIHLKMQEHSITFAWFTHGWQEL